MYHKTVPQTKGLHPIIEPKRFKAKKENKDLYVAVNQNKKLHCIPKNQTAPPSSESKM